MPELQFSTATQENAEEIEKFMFTEFRVNEPITVSLKATEADLSEFFHDLSESGYSHEKYSTLVHLDDRLVAICLCSVNTYEDISAEGTQLEDTEPQDYAKEIAQGPYTKHKANQLVTFVGALERRQRELLGKCCKVLKIDIICVCGEVKNRGLGKELTRRSIEIARTEGCDWVATAATAAASQALFSRMGFQSLYEIPYTSFKENGEVVFKNLHDGCVAGKFMALRVKD
ncbi:Acetyltransferase GNAT family [Trichostrongylus colubriformis]|uniref:aralkylamine N-acetyltransferase n=1 Tax=Trichostrongylus colubriformis TaxID=6319 RepID=A0AAN8EX41_TRICO